ncbi:MAG: hypothetical protein NTZ69_15935 [Bacteroidia bacterium]|nr:hypothetical protein [Bacteroidia bacterium]
MTATKDFQKMSDELNPDFLFNGTYSQLLSRIAKGEIDAKQLAKQELANRGLDINGQWVGFDEAKKQIETTIQTKNVFVLFETDIHKMKTSRVFLGVYETKNQAIDAAKENDCYSSLSEVEIIEAELNKFDEQ